MKRLCLALAALVLVTAAYSISFSEIMYDPLGADDNHEWIEIHNDDNVSVDMSGWKFFEDETNHNLAAVQGIPILQPNAFAVIAEDPITFLSMYNYTGTLFDSTFSLSNTGETIALKNKLGVVTDNFTYSYVLGGSENGDTLGFYRNEWQDTLPTPGVANKVADTCDWSVSYVTKFIFENKNDVAWKILVQKQKGESSIITIHRNVQDIYGNEVRKYDDIAHNITNKETLSYDPNLNSGTYLLKTEISPSCNDTNLNNNHDELLVAVKDAERETKSSVKIESILDIGNDKEAEFGQVIRVHLIAYRGKTGKTVVSVYVQGKDKISKTFSFKIPEEYMEQDVTIPLQLPTNCDGKLKNGTYEVVAEGFDEDDSKEFEVMGSAKDACGKITAEKTTTKETPVEKKIASESQTPEQEVTVSPVSSQKSLFNTAKPYAVSTVVFESAQGKAETLVPSALIVLLAGVSLFVIASQKPF